MSAKNKKKFSNVSDCWKSLTNAKKLEEVKKLIDEFPHWSGEWDWYFDKDRCVVVENTHFDKDADSYITDSETLDVLVEDGYFDDEAERPWDY